LPIENPGQPFEVRVNRHDGLVILEFLGELDASGHDEATAALADAVSLAPRLIMVNLRGLSFMDAMGLRCLFEAKLLADAAGARMVIVSGSGPPHRVVELMGTDGGLEMVDDLTQLDPPVLGPPVAGPAYLEPLPIWASDGDGSGAVREAAQPADVGRDRLPAR
jgi:anti-anti-sigma factor